MVDQGYRGHGVDTTQIDVLISRQRRMVTRTQKRALWQRDVIEPVIGHMKADGFLGWNFLKGAEGDKLNALLCWVGQNLRAILRYLRVLFVSCLLSRVVPRSRLVSPPRADLLTKGSFRNNDLEPFNS